MILTVKDSGALFLDEYETTLDDFAQVLQTNVRDLGRQLFVRADKNVPYGVVMEVMGRIRGCGITDVGLVTVSAPSAPEEKNGNSLVGAGNANAVPGGTTGRK
jgi:biopolymer transport protein TolR